MRNNQILKIFGTEYKEMTKKLLEEADLSARLPEKCACIGIKPNLVSPTPPYLGATTHPEVAAGIIEYLQERGWRNILIAEGSWVGATTSETVEVCGYDKLSEKYGVEIIDTQKDSFHMHDCAGMKIPVCGCVDEIDFLINVPVLKGHCQTRITCALKNLKGLIPNEEKRRFHTLGLHDPIAHLNAGIRQDFIVADHICGDLDFEDGGNPYISNCVMAAADPVLLDAYVCSLLHYSAEDVPYITISEKLGVGSANVSEAEIICVGEDKSAKLPPSKRVVELEDAVEEVDSCSACYGYLIPALSRLKDENMLCRLHGKICIGQGFRGREGELGVGNCTAAFRHSVRGCPPTEEEIYRFLKRYINPCDL